MLVGSRLGLYQLSGSWWLWVTDMRRSCWVESSLAILDAIIDSRVAIDRGIVLQPAIPYLIHSYV